MPRTTIVNCNGMYRSASTLCYILTKELSLREGLHLTIVKEHNSLLTDPGSLNLYTFRDLRDVLRSFCIKYNRRLRDVQIDARNYHAFLDHVIAFDSSVKADERANKLIYRYEDGVLDQVISDMFERFRIAGSRKGYYRDRFGMAAVRQRLPKSGHEEATQLHHNHIHDGATGKWRSFFSEEEQRLLRNNEHLQRWLAQNTYPDC